MQVHCIAFSRQGNPKIYPRNSSVLCSSFFNQIDSLLWLEIVNVLAPITPPRGVIIFCATASARINRGILAIISAHFIKERYYKSVFEFRCG